MSWSSQPWLANISLTVHLITVVDVTCWSKSVWEQLFSCNPARIKFMYRLLTKISSVTVNHFHFNRFWCFRSTTDRRRLSFGLGKMPIVTNVHYSVIYSKTSDCSQVHLQLSRRQLSNSRVVTMHISLVLCALCVIL